MSHVNIIRTFLLFHIHIYDISKLHVIRIVRIVLICVIIHPLDNFYSIKLTKQNIILYTIKLTTN